MGEKNPDLRERQGTFGYAFSQDEGINPEIKKNLTKDRDDQRSLISKGSLNSDLI